MALSPGTRLGPYAVVELLGAGGMGAVYRARDPRLGRDVAIKVLPEEIASDPDRLRRFEQEARAVAALNHPNILSVYDVGTQPADEGAGAPAAAVPYVVTELLEGENLREVLSRRSPTQRQVLGWAVQAAQGLSAAHAKGIVHRDLKPENLFLTTEGRIKVLDFGLAKLSGGAALDTEAVTEPSPTRPGLLMGTVPYMSPEQVQGRPVDARSDLFSFGVVLYELLARRHPFRRETVAATLGAILQEEPPLLVSVDATIPRAVDGVVRRCLEKRREDRFETAHDVALALEAVLAAPAGAAALEKVEERSPYPGLSSFTEKDAAVFFGREEEVAALWKRIRERKLLAVIGPSGAGRTSFLRAGVIPARPQGWAVIACTPGNGPLVSLGRALAPELAADREALQDLLRFDDPEVAVGLAARWRKSHAEAVVVVDQFEELFTLNPPETQARFAALLGRLAREADVHVLLSLRDDFLIRCHEHAALARVFEHLTPLLAVSGDGLRRALVEPARTRGYRFEDEALVAEMVSAVEGARAALPLLAFAVSCLWERRDREEKLLTREAYEEIGGVAGALARHAEATLDRIGSEQQSVVRELFRNLVTAQGTRAVIDREELLSAFPERAAAEDVLRQLIDARLLTSYEVEGKEGESSRHRVEVVHESLLKAWPRLVRWQAQDEEGALLRDQLKQAAHLWEEKGRTADLLWTGTAYREFALWRERYPGALTAVEEGFARSMADKAQRRKRLLRLATTTALLAVTAVAVAIGISRQQAARARDEARAEALRAEAGKLLALGRAEIERFPTAALAYARKSLELADTTEARRFAVEVLWRGPVARVLPVDRVGRELNADDNPPWSGAILSPDSRWLAMVNRNSRRVLLFPSDGGTPSVLPVRAEGISFVLGFGPRSDLLAHSGPGQILRFVSLPDLREVRREALGGARSWGWAAGSKLFTMTFPSTTGRLGQARVWPLPQGEPQVLGPIDWSGVADWATDPQGRWLAYGRGRTLYMRDFQGQRAWRERVLGTQADDVYRVSPFGADGVMSSDKSGEIRIWHPRDGPVAPVRTLRAPYVVNLLLAADGDGTRVARAVPDGVQVWDLRDPLDAEPVVLKRTEMAWDTWGSFDASGRWLVENNYATVAFWPVKTPRRRVLPGHAPGWSLAFTPAGRWLVSCPTQEAALVWPLRPQDGAVRALRPPTPCWNFALHPAGTHVLTGPIPRGEVLLYPLDGGKPRTLQAGWEGAAGTWALAFDAEGRKAAACPGTAGPGLQDPGTRVVRVWDVASGQGRTHSLAHLTDPSWAGCSGIGFGADGSLYASWLGAVRRLTLPSDPAGRVSSETVHAAAHSRIEMSRDGRQLLVLDGRVANSYRFETLLVFDLPSHTSRRIATHGERLMAAAFDASGRVVVTGDADGVVRVGSVDGGEPHLLLGHSSYVGAVAVSPDGRWIASDGDGLSLWPMPDLSKPPFHTLPHDELMPKLDRLTNLRVVPDASSSTGWKLDIGPFPGWKDVPTW